MTRCSSVRGLRAARLRLKASRPVERPSPERQKTNANHSPEGQPARRRIVRSQPINLRAGEQSESAADRYLRIPDSRFPLAGRCRACHGSCLIRWSTPRGSRDTVRRMETVYVATATINPSTKREARPDVQAQFPTSRLSSGVLSIRVNEDRRTLPPRGRRLEARDEGPSCDLRSNGLPRRERLRSRRRRPHPRRGVCWNVGTSWTMWITARLISNTIPVACRIARVIVCEFV